MPKIAVMKCLEKVYGEYDTYQFNVQDSDWVEISDSDLSVLRGWLTAPYTVVEQCDKADVLKFVEQAKIALEKDLAKRNAAEKAAADKKLALDKKRKEKEKQKLLKMLKDNPEVLQEIAPETGNTTVKLIPL